MNKVWWIICETAASSNVKKVVLTGQYLHRQVGPLNQKPGPDESEWHYDAIHK
jgi:hypothetical protein